MPQVVPMGSQHQLLRRNNSACNSRMLDRRLGSKSFVALPSLLEAGDTSVSNLNPSCPIDQQNTAGLPPSLPATSLEAAFYSVSTSPLENIPSKSNKHHRRPYNFTQLTETLPSKTLSSSAFSNNKPTLVASQRILSNQEPKINKLDSLSSEFSSKEPNDSKIQVFSTNNNIEKLIEKNIVLEDQPSLPIPTPNEFDAIRITKLSPATFPLPSSEAQTSGSSVASSSMSEVCYDSHRNSGKHSASSSIETNNSKPNQLSLLSKLLKLSPSPQESSNCFESEKWSHFDQDRNYVPSYSSNVPRISDVSTSPCSPAEDNLIDKDIEKIRTRRKRAPLLLPVMSIPPLQNEIQRREIERKSNPAVDLTFNHEKFELAPDGELPTTYLVDYGWRLRDSSTLLTVQECSRERELKTCFNIGSVESVGKVEEDDKNHKGWVAGIDEGNSIRSNLFDLVRIW
ncbi:hypothetical protein HK096_002722 [Nowakowskiella sp. JEL0078]|nr:hypothetical protein HK096_002722 [Nowakowskiella sp. JEL0078]